MTDSRFNESLRLRRNKGMRGYGVYMRIVELVLSSPFKKIVYDIEDFVFDMHEEADFIKSVVEEYGLFEIQDGFLVDPHTQTPEALERERQERIKANRRAGAKKAALTRAKKKEERQKENPSVSVESVSDKEPETVSAKETVSELLPETQKEPSKTADNNESDEEDPTKQSAQSRLFDSIKSEWNALFSRSYRRYSQLTPDAITWHNFVESSKHYTLEDYKDAFKQALSEKFAWQFKDAIKPANMQRLLSNFEVKRQKEREEYEKLDFETRELIEYGEARGWNWAH